MPKLRQSGITDGGRVLQFEGVARHSVTGIAQILSVTGGREIDLLIGNAPTPPVPTFTAQILGLPGQVAQDGSVTNLSANLFANGVLVEAYVAANWNWTIDDDGSGGASFSGDDLTVGPSAGQVVIRATYDNTSDPANPANGTTITATTNVVATPLTFTVILTGLPASAVQGTIYTLGAERRDGVTQEVLDNDPANFTFVITVGGTFGSIINGNQLQVNASTAGNSITVRATHTVGGEFDDESTNIIAQPTFPNNRPAGHSQLILVDGSTTTWPGFTNSGTEWNNSARISTVVDGASKHGSVTEKKFFVGEGDGWHGLNIYPTSTLFDEVYTGLIFMLSPNWQFHSGGGKLLINRKDIGGQRAVGNAFNLLQGKFFFEGYFKLAGAPNPAVLGASTLAIIPGSPTVGSGVALHEGPFAAIPRGQYVTLEMIRRANSAPGVTDGFMRLWIDGVEYTRFSVIGGPSQYNDFTMDAVEWIHPLNGSAGPPRISPSCEAPLHWGGQGDQKNVNDFIRVSELYISARNL